MIYESQARRSQYEAGTTENSQPTALGASLQPIEDALQRGVDFAKANPLLAVAGAAAVGALVVMAAKKSSRSDTGAIDRMRYDLDRFVSRHRDDASGIGQAISSAFNRVMEAEPETLAAVRKAGEKWVARASEQVRAAAGR